MLPSNYSVHSAYFSEDCHVVWWHVCGFPANSTSYALVAPPIGSYSSRAVKGFSVIIHKRGAKGGERSPQTSPVCWIVVTSDVTPASPAGAGKGGRCSRSVYCRKPWCAWSLLCSEFRRASTRWVISAATMAGYLKVLSSLSRSAATFSRNPAVLAPAAANCQAQRNCEWRLHPQHLYVDISCCFVQRDAVLASLTIWPGSGSSSRPLEACRAAPRSYANRAASASYQRCSLLFKR